MKTTIEVHNNLKIEALKEINQSDWVDAATHDTLKKCLVAINLQSFNSGWYEPVAVEIKCLTGYYMLNQDGSIYCEARVIKQSEEVFQIQYLNMKGWNEFENNYTQKFNPTF